MPDNPLAVLSAVNVRQDRCHDRRALSADEFALLVEAARTGRAVEGVPGEERAILYLLAAWTGLRRKELASLTCKSLALDGEQPTVTISAAYSKNGRADILPLHPNVAEQLRLWLSRRPELGADDPLFRLRSPGGGFRRTSKMMKRDLESARKQWIKAGKTTGEKVRREGTDFLQYCNNDGLFADFHANRHTFISNLAKAGVHPKLAQTLARHSTARST